MKLHFEANLAHQLQAVEAVCDLFRGQEVRPAAFAAARFALGPAEGGGPVVGNRLALTHGELLKNLHDVQLRNGLNPSETLASADFTVEMETGTGKTYVYLRTIFELNKRYGFSKFVIVVPSVAVKEGVHKAIRITEEHFRGLYGNVPFDCFLYDSGRLGQLRGFAADPNIQILIVTVGAINKRDVNNIYGKGANEETGGARPIDLLRATRPILIVDEPQSVDGGLEGRGRQALAAMDPLCALRYSATHVDRHHMIYRLDAIDAYERGLVKRVEIASAAVEAGFNRPYVKVLAVGVRRGVIGARVELDAQTGAGVARREVTVRDGEDLERTTGRAVYAGCRIGEIRAGRGDESVELRTPGGERRLRVGEAHADAGEQSLPRELIRRALREHLDKEKRLTPRGVKVLSLFFIDAVDKYRRYDADGRPLKGEYATLFEEEYARFAADPEYRDLFRDGNPAREAAQVHDGYFSIDRKGGWTETSESNRAGRDSAERAYNLIMRDKERLLSFDTPLRFLFSHSALREGWDNPNVFQICALRDMGTERERRQTIGRGLRLCVDQRGERVRDSEVNTLTVIATERYEAFAENLQKEIERETGIRFGVVEDHHFAAIAWNDEDGNLAALGLERSRALWGRLRERGYLDAGGKARDALKKALRDGSLDLPPEFARHKSRIVEILKKRSGGLEIGNADARGRDAPKRDALQSPEFEALWNRVRRNATYRVAFDNERLIEDCVRALAGAPPVAGARLRWRKADLALGRGAVEAVGKGSEDWRDLDGRAGELPDLLAELEERTRLTRRSLLRILLGSGRLEDFRRDPQRFVELAAESIRRAKRLAVADGVVFRRLGDEEGYAQEAFERRELVERLGEGPPDAVRVFPRLPGWFTVPTPLGSCNPAWAVLVARGEGEELYFVADGAELPFPEGAGR